MKKPGVITWFGSVLLVACSIAAGWAAANDRWTYFGYEAALCTGFVACIYCDSRLPRDE